MRWWHEQYLRAQASNFWHCSARAASLTGAPARRAHYRWADIPDSLLVEWSPEHRRGHKTIRKLEAASPTETTASEPAAQ